MRRALEPYAAVTGLQLQDVRIPHEVEEALMVTSTTKLSRSRAQRYLQAPPPPCQGLSDLRIIPPYATRHTRGHH